MLLTLSILINALLLGNVNGLIDKSVSSCGYPELVATKPPIYELNCSQQNRLNFQVLGHFGKDDVSQVQELRHYFIESNKYNDFVLSTGNGQNFSSSTASEWDTHWQTRFNVSIPWFAVGTNCSKAEIEFSKLSPWWFLPNRFYELIVRLNSAKIRFLFIDTGSYSFQSDQHAWLLDRLKAKNSPSTYVVGQHPLYHSPGQMVPPTLYLRQVFKTLGVIGYFSGFEESLQYYRIDMETEYIVSGVGLNSVSKAANESKGTPPGLVFSYEKSGFVQYHLQFNDNQIETAAELCRSHNSIITCDEVVPFTSPPSLALRLTSSFVAFIIPMIIFG